jgi:hypothetical protein
MADVKFRTTRVALNTTTGTQDITLSGFGTPSAAIFILEAASTDDTVTADANFSIGFTDGTNDRNSLISSGDAVGTSSTHRRTSNALCGLAYRAGGTVSIITAFTHSAWITDGVRINITNANGDSCFATVILIGGTDTANVYAGVQQLTSTSVNVTAPGFEPDLVFVAGNGDSAVNTRSANTIQSLGIAHNDGLDRNRGVFFYDVNGQSTSNVGTYLSTSKSCGQVFNGSATWLGSLDTFDTSGFTVTSTASPGNDYIVYLALSFTNSPDIKLFDNDGPTATGNKSYTDPGFEPDFGMILMSDCTSTDAVQSSGQDGFGVYSFDAVNDYSNAISCQDAQSVTNTACISSSGKIKDLDAGTSVLHEGTFSSFDATGWTFNFTTAPGSARKWIGLAIGPAAGGAFTLTADSGTYAVSGTANSLLLDALFGADSGSYTYTGTAADLNFGYVLSADSGSYTYTGTAANLVFEAPGDFTLAADSGAYTYTGTDASLTAAFTVSADSGSYTYTGAAADLVHGYTLTADSGVYTYSGTNAAFSLTTTLTAESGAYTYSGSNVILKASGQVWTIQSDAITTWSEQSDSSTIWNIQ